MTSDLDLAPSTLEPWRDDAWRFTASRAVHPSNVRNDPSLLVAIAEGLASVAVPMHWTAEPADDGRSYERLLATPEYDAWIIHWPVGTGLATHDHGESAGAVVVVDGELDEDVPGIDGSTVSRHLTTGSTISFDIGYVHAVVNRASVPATSIHVYSPPVSSMGFYRTEPDGRLVLDRVEE